MNGGDRDRAVKLVHKSLQQPVDSNVYISLYHP
jgi:hypothetical protein